MTRDAACRAIHDALANAGISTNRNGKPISVRTVLSYYENERILAIANGPIDYDEFSFVVNPNIEQRFLHRALDEQFQ